MLEFVKAVNEWMWGLILLIILCGTGIFFTIRLKFIQVRKFGEGCRLVFGHFKSSGGERKEGEMISVPVFGHSHSGSGRYR